MNRPVSQGITNTLYKYVGLLFGNDGNTIGIIMQVLTETWIKIVMAEPYITL